MVAAGVLAGGVGHQAVEAVAAKEPNRTSCRGSRRCRAPTRRSTLDCPIRNSKQATSTSLSLGPVDASAVRAAVGKALARPRAGASTSQPSAGAGPGAGQLADATTAPAANATQPVRAVVETAKTVVKEVPKPPLPPPPRRGPATRRSHSRRCRRSRPFPRRRPPPPPPLPPPPPILPARG